MASYELVGRRVRTDVGNGGGPEPSGDHPGSLPIGTVSLFVPCGLEPGWMSIVVRV